MDCYNVVNVNIKFQGENRLNTGRMVPELVSIYVEKNQNNGCICENRGDVNSIN